MAIRRMGKASFTHIQDNDGRIQIYLKKDDIGEYYDAFKLLDIGDIIGIEGFVFKDVLKSYILFDKQLIGNTILCVSAKDGYRVTFSLSEILNRNDMNDFLLIEKTGSLEEGKYNLFATPDFFVDRNVRSVERIEILTVN